MGSQAIQAALWGRNAADWAQIQEVISTEGYEYALDHLQLKPTDTLLDIGCGAGYFCQLAATRMKQAQTGNGAAKTPAGDPTAQTAKAPAITGFDATVPLLEEARRRSPELTFETGDMESLPFDDEKFDVASGFNSFQYAASVPNALKEAHRVLKSGGKIITMIWGNKEDCEAATYLAAIGQLLPTPPPGAPGPFALSEGRKLEQLLSAAGFKITTTTDLPTVWDYPDLATTMKGLLSAGPATRAIDYSGYEKVYQTISNAVQPYLQPNGHVVYHNKFRIVMASK
jgi:SAM-dependent methyltransferase